MTAETRSALTDKNNTVSPQPLERPTAKAMWRLLLFFIFYMIFRLLVEVTLSVSCYSIGPTLPQALKDFLILGESAEEILLTGDCKVIISGIGFLVAGLMIRAKAFEYDKKYTARKEVSNAVYALIALAAMSMALFLNILILKSGITEISEEYAEVAEAQYDCGFLVGFIVYGFISPLSEEFMFRGILYNGFKRYFKMMAALLMSSAFFSLYHGNGVQGMYSFAISVFIVYSYEKTGNFPVTVLIHMVCNLTAYIFTYAMEALSQGVVNAAFGLSFVIAAACIYVLFFMKKKIASDKDENE
ncbi:MAG: CPBP family intramembrane metalloprotease [Lachnospiraceae bacterium]|nr:CPBP family intramembrane metalloprotease [Lachnospiraceae bacterium]